MENTELDQRERDIAAKEAEVERFLTTARQKVTTAQHNADSIREKAHKDAARRSAKADADHKKTMDQYAVEISESKDAVKAARQDAEDARATLAGVQSQIAALRQELLTLLAVKQRAAPLA